MLKKRDDHLSVGVTALKKELRRIRSDAPSTTYLLYRAHQFSEAVWGELVGDRLTPRQYHLLTAVRSLGRSSQRALVEETGIDRSTLSEMVRRMTADGLLNAAAKDSDARVRLVELGAAGRRALKAVDPLAQLVDAYIESSFQQRDLASLHALLEAILALPVTDRG